MQSNATIYIKTPRQDRIEIGSKVRVKKKKVFLGKQILFFQAFGLTTYIKSLLSIKLVFLLFTM